MITVDEGSPPGVTLITGGAGFIGANLADRLLSLHRRVRILDNLSRPGVERNLSWLEQTHRSRLEVELGDVRDARRVHAAMRNVTQVFHLAAQVAVTTSVLEPQHDFEVNARGTLNVLEAARRSPRRPGIVFTSTNKVYGELHAMPLAEDTTRYQPLRAADLKGVSENCPLDFSSPYGCSKGAADQYVLDYARTFSVPATVFRMSCIYGPHQFGTEDQGWIAHFLLRVLAGQPITVYGDGRQVRDILFVADLINAFLVAQARIEHLSGTAFNIGGGLRQSISLLELIDLIERVHGARPAVEFAPWRLADQRYFVSDTSRFRNATGWSPHVGVHHGVMRLYQWLRETTSGAAQSAAATSHAATVPSFVAAEAPLEEPTRTSA
jgi:CDP-paratose 2-epimerase